MLHRAGLERCEVAIKASVGLDDLRPQGLDLLLQIRLQEPTNHDPLEPRRP